MIQHLSLGNLESRYRKDARPPLASSTITEGRDGVPPPLSTSTTIIVLHLHFSTILPSYLPTTTKSWLSRVYTQTRDSNLLIRFSGWEVHSESSLSSSSLPFLVLLSSTFPFSPPCNYKHEHVNGRHSHFDLLSQPTLGRSNFIQVRTNNISSPYLLDTFTFSHHSIHSIINLPSATLPSLFCCNRSFLHWPISPIHDQAAYGTSQLEPHRFMLRDPILEYNN